MLGWKPAHELLWPQWVKGVPILVPRRSLDLKMCDVGEPLSSLMRKHIWSVWVATWSPEEALWLLTLG